MAFTDIGFRDAAAAAQLFQGLGEAALDAFKHTASLLTTERRAAITARLRGGKP